MRKAISIFAALVILLSSTSNAVLVLEFKLNQQEIERLYCVNKAKPQLHCHGKCHLKKQLLENNDRNSKPSPKSQLEDAYKINFFQEQVAAIAPIFMEDDKLPNLSYQQIFNSRLFGTSTFQPPDNQPLA